MAETVQPAPIEEWRGVDAARFRDEIAPRNRPAVLRGAADDWPLVERATRSPKALVDYLIGFDNGELVTTSIAPPEVEGRLVYIDGRKELNHRRSVEKLPNVLKGLLKLIDEPHPPGIWIGGLRAIEQMPQFERDNRTDLVPSGTPAHLWIGNAVTIPPHFDAADNLGFVVAGRRCFTLFPPEQVSNLYVGPMDLTPSECPGQHGPARFAGPGAVSAFPRRSRRRFFGRARARRRNLHPLPVVARRGIHRAGQHAREFLVVQRPGRGPASARSLLRASYELFRNMPAEHRAAWRRMYEYWVFEADGDPMKDLPEAQHTASARLDPEAIARFKRSLVELFGTPPDQSSN